MLERNWSRDTTDLRRGDRTSPAKVLAGAARVFVSTAGDGRIVEAGRGSAEEGFGIPDTGRGCGSRERRCEAVALLSPVASIAC